MSGRLIFHLACIIALAWPALINRQPFYFPDTTAYVRSADIAAYIFSGQRIRTAWTDHYIAAMATAPGESDARPETAGRGNDLSQGSIMSGRSPYFGAILWVSYVLSLFWLFVLAQAAIAYVLIRLCLRVVDLQSRVTIAAAVGLLSVLTTLPFYVGLLMPDLLAAFAMIAFALLAVAGDRLSGKERLFLAALMALSAISHLTHIWILLAMAAVLLLVGLMRPAQRARYRAAMGAVAIAITLGIGSVAITDHVVERQFGREPQLVPLLTARFMADGPGRAYLQTHCPDAGFAICAYRDRRPLSAPAFLWATAPGEGIYLLASPAERAAMASEDKAFAWAVLRAYPLEQTRMIVRNSLAQLLRFDSGLLNYPCGEQTPCGLALPAPDRQRLMHSLGGRGLWPQQLLAVLHYGAVGGSVLLLVAWAASGSRAGFTTREREILLILAMLLAGMAINALLGGAVSEPQNRYQARIVWLLPLVAILAGLSWHRRPAPPGDR